MKNILLRGPFLTQSGYGVHCRQIAEYLFKKIDSGAELKVDFELLPWGMTPWLVNTSTGLVGRIVENARKSNSYDVSIQVQLPNEWNAYAASYNIGVTAGVETDICNPTWIDCVNRMDLVIVPSEFTKQAFINSAKNLNKELRTEIVVVPESFSEDMIARDSDISVSHLDSLPTDFNFLIFGQLTGNNPDNDRKNLGYTLKMLYETFRDNENVGIIIKTNAGRNTTIDRMNVQNLLSQLQMQLKFKDSKGPKVYLMHGEMHDKEISAMYRHPKIKALLSLTRGEGFGLPFLEAAANDLPVIATDWSAYTEFLNKGKWVKIEKDLINIHESRVDNQIFIPGAKWAAARETDASNKLKKFLIASQIPKQWAIDLGKVIRQEYSAEAIQKKYDSVIGDKLTNNV